MQFVPAFSPLTEEALKHADTADFEGVPFRVVRADYLATIALSVGRAKDYARILALLESSAATREEIARLAAKHGLSEAWRRFEARFGDEVMRERLERAARWQRGRKALSWPGEVRLAEAIRDSLAQLRQSRLSRAPASPIRTQPPRRSAVDPTDE